MPGPHALDLRIRRLGLRKIELRPLIERAARNVRLDGRTIGDGKPGPMMQKLLGLFRELTKKGGFE